MLPNRGAVFVNSVIISRNCSGANIGALPHVGVPKIRQVRQFSPRPKVGVFTFRKRPNSRPVSQHRVLAKIAKWAHGGLRPDNRINSVSADNTGPTPHLNIVQGGVGTDVRIGLNTSTI